MPRFRQRFTGPPDIPFTINWNSIQARGLSHWWPGDSEYANYVSSANGVRTGTATIAPTATGRAFYLPGGTSNYVNCGNPANLQTQSYLTITAWIYTNTLTGGGANLRSAFGNEGDNSGFMLRLHTADDTLNWYVYSGGYRVATMPGTMAVDTWYHVVCVYDIGSAAASQLKLYVNGIQAAVGTSGGAAIVNSSVAFGIGLCPYYTDRSWSGYIRDVRVYSGTVLSPAEIYQQFDPITRWELYKPLRRMWAAGASGAVLPPDAPSGLSATAIDSGQIDLAWTDESADETGFKIQRSTDGVTFTDLDTAAAEAESYSDTTCAANTRYWYKVCATNAGGDSAYTTAANAKTAPDSAAKNYKFLFICGGQVEQSDGRYYALVDGVLAPDTVAGVAWLYVDQTDGLLKAKYGDGKIKIIATDSIVTVTNTYDILATDDTVICNKTAAFTVTLPVAVVGQSFNIKNIGAGIVTVVGQGGTDTIDGEVSQTVNQWDCMIVQCYAANKWVII